jgi:hypothetical protein
MVVVMSAGQHTPGPWTLNPARSTRVDLIDNAKGEAVGEIIWVDTRKPADARLIAAAPDLLEALERILRDVPCDGLDEWEGQARAAIAKATGETK